MAIEKFESEWYIVEISPDNKDRQGKPALSREYEKRIEDWIADQFRNGVFSTWIEFGFCKYGFRREEDAAAFKLRWL